MVQQVRQVGSYPVSERKLSLADLGSAGNRKGRKPAKGIANGWTGAFIGRQ